jgi:hypothetical protein|tara:strand:- start:1527 stop:1751 length:225 start_codon:yes stop_codon:yes gene_type:complete
MNKVKLLDNGLTPEQQEVMDEAYEALMSEVKVIDLTLYEKLRENELSLSDVYKLRNSKEQKRMIRIEDGQYNLL